MSSTCSLAVAGPHVRQATSPSKECVTAVWLPVPLAPPRLTARVASAPESTSMESVCRIVLLALSSIVVVVWSVIQDVKSAQALPLAVPIAVKISTCSTMIVSANVLEC